MRSCNERRTLPRVAITARFALCFHAMIRGFTRFAPLLLSGVLLAAPAAAPAQSDADGTAGDWSASRQTLETELSRLQQLAQSPAYGARLRADAASQMAAIRHRLTTGDFAIGDRFIVEVTGSVPLSDTVTVLAGPSATIGTFGELPLTGVLRSELASRVESLVRRTVLDAGVQVRPLLRLAVFGSVTAPGYVLVPPETRVDELLTLAGGPSIDADLQKMRVMRADTVVMRGSEILLAISHGRTVAQLGLQEGDLLNLRPQTPPWNRETVLQLVSLFLAPIITVLIVR